MTTTIPTDEQERILRQSWQTPRAFMAALRREFPDLLLDVCATPENRKCRWFFAPPWQEGQHPDCLGLDGLKQPWGRLKPCTCWCNAGFGDILPWMRKAADEADAGAQVLLVTHTGVTTDWWRLGMERAAECRLLIPRVQYVAPPGVKQSSNNRDGALWVFRARRPRLGAQVVHWGWAEEAAEEKGR